MKSLGLLAVIATSAFAPAAGAVTPYLSTVSDGSCKGLTSCTLSFPNVAAGEALTITHVSCGILTTGESASVANLVLSRAKATVPALGDHLQFVSEINGANIENIANEATLFYVPAADHPTIAITSGATISGTTDGGCLISGTTTP